MAERAYGFRVPESKVAPAKPIVRQGFLIAFGIAILIAVLYFFSQTRSIFIGLLIGAAAGFIFWFFSKKEQKKNIVLTLIIFAAIGGVIGYFWGPITSYAGLGVSSLKDVVLPLFSQFKQTTSAEYYQKLMQTPTTNQEGISMNVELTNPYFREGNPLDAVWKITFSPLNASMRVIPKSCSLNGDALSIESPDMLFIKSDKEQIKSLHCKGTAKDGTVKLELQRPVSIRTVLPVTIAPVIETNLGGASSRTDAPFSIITGSYSSQPLTPGTYDFYLLLKRNEQDAELADIKSLKITTASPDLKFECPKFSSIENLNVNGVEISNLDSADLKNYAQSPKSDLFAFNCKLSVLRAVEEENLYIVSEALYNVKNTYSKKITAVA